MNNSKRITKCKNQLNSNSTLFLQLGILLALVLVYNTIELKFYKKVFHIPERSELVDEPDVFIFPPFEIEKPELHEEVSKEKVTKLLNKIKIEEDKKESPKEEFVLNKPLPSVNYDSIFADVPLIEENPKETIPFILVEQAPRYPGCKGNSEEEYKKCFQEKIKKFVSRKFNSNFDLNLSGKQRIDMQFEIDKNGNIVNIKARAAHKRLEKEAIRVLLKLPKMEPAKQRNKKVGVNYVLPIAVYFE
jgi:protein TonB